MVTRRTPDYTAAKRLQNTRTRTAAPNTLETTNSRDIEEKVLTPSLDDWVRAINIAAEEHLEKMDKKETWENIKTRNEEQ